jgi:hypothetical protein
LKTGAFAVGALLAAAAVDLGWRPLMLSSGIVEILAVMVGLLISGGRRPAYRGSRSRTDIAEG